MSHVFILLISSHTSKTFVLAWMEWSGGRVAFRYEVSLKGQASKLDFRLDKTELDFGEVPYTEAGSSSRSGLAVHVCAYHILSCRIFYLFKRGFFGSFGFLCFLWGPCPKREVQEREVILANSGKAAVRRRPLASAFGSLLFPAGGLSLQLEPLRPFPAGRLGLLADVGADQSWRQGAGHGGRRTRLVLG